MKGIRANSSHGGGNNNRGEGVTVLKGVITDVTH